MSIATRVEPRISVNKLGEFLTSSSPVRRRAIVRDQKHPRTFITARYRSAFDPIEEFLSSSGENTGPISVAIETLRSAPANTNWQAEDNANTAEALEQFIEVADQLPRDGITYSRGDNEQPGILIAGVSISVRPDFLLHFSRKGKDFIGSLKLHFIRNDENALTEDAQAYVATVCHHWLNEFQSDLYTPCRKHCLSFDVFRGRVVEAPQAITRRMASIQAACQEIAALWPTL